MNSKSVFKVGNKTEFLLFIIVLLHQKVTLILFYIIPYKFEQKNSKNLTSLNENLLFQTYISEKLLFFFWLSTCFFHEKCSNHFMIKKIRTKIRKSNFNKNKKK